MPLDHVAVPVRYAAMLTCDTFNSTNTHTLRAVLRQCSPSLHRRLQSLWSCSKNNLCNNIGFCVPNSAPGLWNMIKRISILGKVKNIFHCDDILISRYLCSLEKLSSKNAFCQPLASVGTWITWTYQNKLFFSNVNYWLKVLCVLSCWYIYIYKTVYCVSLLFCISTQRSSCSNFNNLLSLNHFYNVQLNVEFISYTRNLEFYADNIGNWICRILRLVIEKVASILTCKCHKS